MHKAIFLDRDGTLNPDPGYISNPDDFNLYEGVAEALYKLQQAGFLLILITNQSGIARGLITPEQLASIHAKMQNQLARAGARIDAIYLWPHHPDFPHKDGLTDCDCRKPRPGLLQAEARLGAVDFGGSWMVGDRDSDVAAGAAAGCRTVFIDRGWAAEHGHGADAIAATLDEAADAILST